MAVSRILCGQFLGRDDHLSLPDCSKSPIPRSRNRDATIPEDKSGRLGECAGESRCDDWQTFYRARDDRDFLRDGAAPVLSGVMSSGVETSLISDAIPAKLALITANEGWFSASVFHPPDLRFSFLPG